MCVFLYSDNHLQHKSGITVVIMSAVKWFHRASFASDCFFFFLLLDFTTFLLHETSSHLRSGVHQEEFFGVETGCMRSDTVVDLHVSEKVKVHRVDDLQYNTSSSLISSHQHLCHNKTTRLVGLRSLRHSKTKSQASAQNHTWHFRLSHTRLTLQFSQKHRGRACRWLKLRAVST